MTDTTAPQRRPCFFLHRWEVIETKEQQNLSDMLPWGNIKSLEMNLDLAEKMNNRKALVKFRCMDCGTERVQRV